MMLKDVPTQVAEMMMIIQGSVFEMRSEMNEFDHRILAA